MTPAGIKSLLTPYQTALMTAEPNTLTAAISTLFAPTAEVKLCHPFGTGQGPQSLLTAFAPLLSAMPDLERRDMIVIAGTSPEGQD